jgi:hypothetical protein
MRGTRYQTTLIEVIKLEIANTLDTATGQFTDAQNVSVLASAKGSYQDYDESRTRSQAEGGNDKRAPTGRVYVPYSVAFETAVKTQGTKIRVGSRMFEILELPEEMVQSCSGALRIPVKDFDYK